MGPPEGPPEGPPPIALAPAAAETVASTEGAQAIWPGRDDPAPAKLRCSTAGCTAQIESVQDEFQPGHPGVAYRCSECDKGDTYYCEECLYKNDYFFCTGCKSVFCPFCPMENIIKYAKGTYDPYCYCPTFDSSCAPEGTELEEP
jgi:hypothetical protein